MAEVAEVLRIDPGFTISWPQHCGAGPPTGRERGCLYARRNNATAEPLPPCRQHVPTDRHTVRARNQSTALPVPRHQTHNTPPQTHPTPAPFTPPTKRTIRAAHPLTFGGAKATRGRG